MFILGHTLVWHNQTPMWAFEVEVGKPIVSTRSLSTTAKMKLGAVRVIEIPTGPRQEAVLLVRVKKHPPGE